MQERRWLTLLGLARSALQRNEPMCNQGLRRPQIDALVWTRRLPEGLSGQGGKSPTRRYGAQGSSRYIITPGIWVNMQGLTGVQRTACRVQTHAVANRNCCRKCVKPAPWQNKLPGAHETPTRTLDTACLRDGEFVFGRIPTISRCGCTMQHGSTADVTCKRFGRPHVGWPGSWKGRMGQGGASGLGLLKSSRGPDVHGPRLVPSSHRQFAKKPSSSAAARSLGMVRMP